MRDAALQNFPFHDADAVALLGFRYSLQSNAIFLIQTNLFPFRSALPAVSESTSTAELSHLTVLLRTPLGERLSNAAAATKLHPSQVAQIGLDLLLLDEVPRP